MSGFEKRTVLVTGGFGFIGSNLARVLGKAGAKVRLVSRREREDAIAGDLTHPDTCAKAVEGVQDVFHLAAFGFGLGANQEHPAQLLTQNVLMSTNLLEAARKAGVERYLYTSSSAVYPAHVEVLDEAQAWDTAPHGTEATFGWAKRLAEVQARAYVDEYGMNIAIVRPSNPYGPGDDLDAERSHVIPALIRKVVERNEPLTVWGSGRAIRSFVYVDDIVRGMMLSIEKAGDGDPINLASPETTSIGDLIRLLIELDGFEGANLVFDTSKPEGHPRKVPSVEKAEKKIGFRAETSLKDGLSRTLEWFRQHVPQ